VWLTVVAAVVLEETRPSIVSWVGRLFTGATDCEVGSALRGDRPTKRALLGRLP